MQVRRSQVGWGFWILYVLASTFGMLVGFVLGFFLVDALPDVVGEWFGTSVLGIVLGMAVGILQWLVLRRRVSGAGWWIFASAIGGFAIFQAGLFFGFSTEYESSAALLGWAGVVALGGVAAGTLQWLVLRGQAARAGWWVLASTVGWVLSVMGVRELPWGVDPSDLLWGMVATGAVLGVVTGGVLVWLLRHRVQEV